MQRPHPTIAVKNMTREQYREWALWLTQNVKALARRRGLPA